MLRKLFVDFLRRNIRSSGFTLVLPDGSSHPIGPDPVPGLVVRIHSPAALRRLLLNPELAFGECYMDATLTVDGDDLRGLFGVLLPNMRHGVDSLPARALMAARQLRRRWLMTNPAARSKRNVAHHYDLSGELYDLFLDEDRQYSCAYFARPDMTLEQAQEAKKRHIAAKLLLEPGMKVLDIGSGWGGLGLTLARDYGAQVVGVTLSEEQHAVSRRRAEQAGLAGQVEFRLQDYRSIPETFDRIVSVGMFEHVGVPHYRTFFATVRDRLTEDGVALLHTIGRMDPPGTTNAWLSKYIFPGGYTPALSEVAAAVELEGLFITDVEVWRLHYAETLRHWCDRFDANRARVAQLYDERFCRMWRFYLISCEMAFREYGQVVFQIQLARKQDAVPLTRDYLYRDGPGGADAPGTA